MKQEWEAHAKRLRGKFRELAAERSDDEERAEAIVEEIFRLLLHGT
jgi:branched-subunit amino acid aminotransferase/4-amino-4-deoxychorismate lyase